MKVFSTDNNFSTNMMEKNKYQIGDPRIICKILSDSLYSNKIGSIIRELSANAIDAHKENGKENIPFTVHCPLNNQGLFSSDENLYFSIRDYGKGLSHEDMISIYTMYGASTKRGTNSQIGGFGIGCKSPFSYVNQFEVVSWNNGRKCHYICYIDGDEYPCITKVSDEETNEPSGLMVKIPISDEKDCDAFMRECYQQYSFYKVKPDINIALPNLKAFIEDDNYAVYIKKGNREEIERIHLINKYDNRFNTIPLSFSYQTVFCVQMNSYIYNIPLKLFDGNTNEYADEYALLHDFMFTDGATVLLKLNTGDADISASREELAITDKTRNSISNALNHFRKTLLKYIGDMTSGMTDMQILDFCTSNTLLFTVHSYSSTDKGDIVPNNDNEKRILDIMRNGIEFDVNPLGDYLIKNSIKMYDYNSKWTRAKKLRSGYDKAPDGEYLFTNITKNRKTGACFFNMYGCHFKLFFMNKNVYIRTFLEYAKKNLHPVRDEILIHLYLTDNQKDIDFILKEYKYPDYEVLDLHNSVVKKQKTSNDKTAVSGMIEYTVVENVDYYSYNRGSLSNIRQIKSNGDTFTVLEADAINDFKKENTFVIVTDNNEYVDNSIIKENMGYQRLVIPFLENFHSMYRQEYNVIFMNVKNYLKYCKLAETNNLPMLNADAFYERVKSILSRHNDWYDNLNDIINVYLNNSDKAYWLVKNIPERYAETHRDVEFFDIIWKLKKYSRKYVSRNLLSLMMKLIEIKDNISFNSEDIEANDVSKRFIKYIEDNPLLYVYADNTYTLSNKEDISMEILNKYVA